MVVTDEAISVLNPGLRGPTSGDPYVMHVEVVVSLAVQEIGPHLTSSIIIRDEGSE